jgi:hypothetical protein
MNSVLATIALTATASAALVVALWVTGLLAVLNIILAIVYRGRGWKEVASYGAAALIELVAFTLSILFLTGVIADVPFHLPPNLPFSQAYIGAALALGLGLLPVTFWHRVNVSELPKRIAEDGKSFDSAQAKVRVRSPGEWIN